MMTGRVALAGLLAMAACLWLPAAPARAHARLVAATPPSGAVLGTAPARIDLVFDEELDPEKSRVRVFDASGAWVDRGDLCVTGKRMTIGVRDLPTGQYSVRWLAVADDDSSGWHLRAVNVTAAIPPGTRLLFEGLEGPEGIMWTLESGLLRWTGARLDAHTYGDPYAFNLEISGLPPGTPLPTPEVTVTFQHTTPPLFHDRITVP